MRIQPTLNPMLVFHKLSYGRNVYDYALDRDNTPENIDIQAKHGYTVIGLQYDSYAWPGGYPIFYLTADNGVLCPDCANKNISLCACPVESKEADPMWRIVAADINYEDESHTTCDHCYQPIEYAYEDDKE